MELFKLFGTIALDNSEANKGIDETTDKAEKSYPKISAAFEKIGSAAIKIGKGVVTGIAAGSAAIGALAKQSLDSYAEYEQLIGGVETLYGTEFKTIEEYAESLGKKVSEVYDYEWEQFSNRQEAVLRNAANAYKTAGMSANDYMNTVNGFAASLTSSLGEYGWQAANYADMIVTDMADNANKMGTSLDSIQNAYSGFAKQNYTMLDNLKLGYGGTKEEMERLLRDAEKYAGYIEGSLKIESFADVADAIHIVQEQMGITGTTAKEASGTISGSLAATKSAWQNLLTGFADGNQDLGLLIGNLVESATTAANNIVPRIVQILSSISNALPQVMAVVSAELPGLVESLLPGVITGATALMTGLITMLPQILAILIEQIPFIITQIGTAISQAFPVLLETVKNLFGQIWDYIAVELLGTEADFESSFGKIKGFFEGLWTELQSLWESVGQPIWDAISECVGIVQDAFSERMPAIKEFVSGCFEDISEFWNEHLKPCFQAIGSFLKDNLAPVFKDVFTNKIMPVVDTCFAYIKGLWDALKTYFTGIIDFLTGVFTGNWRKAWDGIKGILKGILNGIINSVELMINGAILALNGLISGINKLISKAGSLLGLNISIPTINKLSLPRLEKGGILEKGQVGLLEGNGAEAVVPLDQNRAWINAVARDMQAAAGGKETSVLLERILDAIVEKSNDLEEKMESLVGSMCIRVDGRELGRIVDNELGRFGYQKARGRI